MKNKNTELIKVFLVEDEIVIRNGIKRSINWEEEGFSFAGEASDGELALPLILEKRPDILITDIKMPFMDGLELSQEVKKEIPNIKILILSGYDEFNYAREAIKIGVTEYLLKPVSASKLISTLKEISKVIAEERYNTKELVKIGTSRDIIEKFLINGTMEEVELFVNSYINRIEEEKLLSVSVRQYMIVDFYTVIISFCEKLGVSYDSIKQELDYIQNELTGFLSVRDVKNYIYNLVTMVIKLRDENSEKRYQDIISQAKDIISSLYRSSEISLNSVSSSVGLSPSYFSTVFARETGQTFKEYLTDIRMEKAKELLMCTSMQAAEIGYEVGYKDPHYFSFIFKKKQGCSPTEYRNRGKE